MTVTLSEIFVKKSGISLYSRDELASLTIKKEFIKRVAQYYDIPYVLDGTKENNLCYANSSAIRFVYKSSFSEKDIVSYLLSSLKQETFDINSAVATFT